jgi:hypothetical protein
MLTGSRLTLDRFRVIILDAAVNTLFDVAPRLEHDQGGHDNV